MTRYNYDTVCFEILMNADLTDEQRDAQLNDLLAAVQATRGIALGEDK